MKAKNKITTALLASGLLLPAMAQARWFEVEVILFARNQDPALVAEKFPEQIEPLSERRRLDILELIYEPPQECIQPGDDQSSLPMTQDLLTTQVSQPCPDPAVADSTDDTEQQPDELVESAETTDGVDGTEVDLLTAQPGDELTGENALEEIVDSLIAEQALPAGPVFAEFSPVSPVKPELDEEAYLLTAEMLQFGEILQKLEQHGAYRPMLHTGWRMDFDSKRKMPTLHLVAGRNYGDEYDVLGNLLPIEEVQPEIEAVLEFVDIPEASAQPNTTESNEQPLLAPEQAKTETNGSVSLLAQAQSEVTEQSASLIQPGPDSSKQVVVETVEEEPELPPVWEMEANLKLWLETWLHVAPQIQLRIPSERDEPIQQQDDATLLAETPETADEQQDAVVDSGISLLDGEGNQPGSLVQQSNTVSYLHSYEMDQFRRVRSEEIHYFDHPLMGMIIQIRKFEPVTLESLEEQD